MTKNETLADFIQTELARQVNGRLADEAQIDDDVLADAAISIAQALHGAAEGKHAALKALIAAAEQNPGGEPMTLHDFVVALNDAAAQTRSSPRPSSFGSPMSTASTTPAQSRSSTPTASSSSSIPNRSGTDGVVPLQSVDGRHRCRFRHRDLGVGHLHLASASKATSRGGVRARPRESGEAVLTVSGKCMCDACERRTQEAYRMIGRCLNCGAEPILMIFRAGDRTRELTCPVCDCWSSVRAKRLATEDEIPVAVSGGNDRPLPKSRWRQ